MIKNLFKGKKVITTLAVLAAIALFGAIIVIPRLNILTQGTKIEYESIGEMAFGQNGHTLLIDNGKKTLLVLDENNCLIERHDGGDEMAAFFYVTHMAEMPGGDVIISDITYGERGTLVDKERIIKLTKFGSKVIYEYDYMSLPTEEQPLQYGRIMELQEYEGDIYYTFATDSEVTVNKLIGGAGDPETIRKIEINSRLNDASYDVSTDHLVIAYRTGRLVAYSSNGVDHNLNSRLHQIPWDICARNGEVFYTDVTKNDIVSFNLDDIRLGQMAPYSSIYEGEDVLYKLDVNKDASALMTTDYWGYFRMPLENGRLSGEEEYFTEAPVSFMWLEILLIITSLLGGLSLSIIIIYLAMQLFIYVSHSETAIRALFVILACLSVASILSYTLLGQILADNTKASEEKTRIFAELLLAKIDTNALETITNPDDFRNEDYTRVKDPLDDAVWKSYENGDYYYYIIYRESNGYLTAIMDFEETSPPYNPVYLYGEEPYTSVMETGAEESYSENDAYGAWTFILLPIYDENGDIIAELEVGRGLDALNKVQSRLMWDVVINAGISTIVIVMLILEFAFFLGFSEKRRSEYKNSTDPTETVPVRTMMFITYLCDSMQDAFIVLLCDQLYEGGLPISPGLAVTLPISAQLFFMAVASAFVGKLTARFGSRKTMTVGLLIQAAGSLICLIFANYAGLFIGKMLIGTAMGVIYVSCNTVAAMGATEQKAGDAFAGVSAGTLSGLTIGAGLTSVLLSLGGWKLIYAVGAVLLLMGAGISATSGDARPGHKEEDISMQKDITTGQFIFNKRILGFFVLLLLPFMIALAFRECFFPFVAAESGADEVTIGRIYLICGLMALYVGPTLSAYILKKIGAFWAIVVSSVGMVLTLATYVIYPSFISVIIGMVILSLVVSFAYTCQYTYFELLPECTLYGEGNAMSIYSVVESAGQTIGPMAYGIFLSFGYRPGLLVALIIFTAALIVFVLLGRRTAALFR